MLKEMFSYKGKMTKVIPASQLKSYQKIYEYLQKKVKNGQLPSHDNYLNGNELAINIFRKKYYVKDLQEKPLENRPEDVFTRISSFIAATESTEAKQKEWAEKFYNDLHEGYFLPGGRVLAGAGDLYRLKTLANCFVTQIEEDN
ncbi:MAG: ribonucleoside-diphosphate reductase, adenosylcobalamin-dependent, partial [Calditrichia bacterium]|nr:ribonucleoside-diphosphate reductase, adenosylcobalamin-dependent [Calditrichia bacterium]